MYLWSYTHCTDWCDFMIM